MRLPSAIHPDYDTVASFRKRFLGEIDAFFVHILQIAHQMGFRQFLLRGLRAVRGEWSLVSFAFNLKRSVRTDSDRLFFLFEDLAHGLSKRFICKRSQSHRRQSLSTYDKSLMCFFCPRCSFEFSRVYRKTVFGDGKHGLKRRTTMADISYI
jgi:hypothetical protein